MRWLLALALLVAPAATAGDFEVALAAYRAGDHALALAGFEKLVATSPNYHYGHFMIGICQLRLGQSDAAVAAIKRAIELDPSRFAYHNGLATAYLARGESAAALTAVDKGLPVVQQDPERYQMHRHRGLALLGLERYEEAARDLAAARALRPTPDLDLPLGVARLYLGQLGEAVAALSRAAAHAPGSLTAHAHLAEAHLRQARATRGKLRRTAYAAAIAPAQQATTLAAADAPAWSRLAEAQMGARQFSAAATSYRKLLELRPGSCPARINLGRAELARGRWKPATAVLEKARACAGKAGVVLEGLAFARVKQGNLAGARELYEEALRVAPSRSLREGLKLVEAKLERRELLAAERREAEALERRMSEVEAAEERLRKWNERGKQ